MTASLRHAGCILPTLFAAALLYGCGGGGSADSCRSIDPSRTGCGAAAASSALPTGGSLQLVLLGAAANGEAATSSLTLQRPGTLKLQLKDVNGSPVTGAVVTVSSTDKTAVLTPSTGSALTDASGNARIGIAAGSQAGAFSATATATVAGKDVNASIGYTVSFPVLTMSALSIAPTPLAAGGTASLSVTVLDGGQPFAPAQSVSFTSPCATAGKAAISSPVVTVAGVATTSYLDKGCGAPDTVTATTVLAGSSVSQTGNVTSLGATAGQLAFVSALPQNIAIKGTGGPGRQESSTVMFKVLDRNGNPVSGALVNFALFGTTSNIAGTGGLTLNPAQATSGADGSVSTTLLAGIVNTPVRVTASIANSSPLVSSTSDQLVISTGIPDQASFSLSTSVYNVEGGNFNGCQGAPGAILTVSLADHFHNPVPDGTAISFTAEGGVVDASCLTGLDNTQLVSGVAVQQKGIPGQCKVRFCSANPRPSDSRVTVMAYALGEESFYDDPAVVSGINRYDEAESFQDLCEPVRYDTAIVDEDANPVAKFKFYSASRMSDPAVQAALRCPAPKISETFIDTNGDGVFNDSGDRQYNGVLRLDANGQTVANSRSPTVHVRASLVQVMSGSNAVFTLVNTPSTLTLDHCADGHPFPNKTYEFTVAVRDSNPTIFPGNSLPGNILPAGTRIEFITSNGTVVDGASRYVINTNSPASSGWTYTAAVRSDASQGLGGVCSNPSTTGFITVRATTPMGIVTEAKWPVTD
jgi:hypothetical protein